MIKGKKRREEKENAPFPLALHEVRDGGKESSWRAGAKRERRKGRGNLIFPSGKIQRKRKMCLIRRKIHTYVHARKIDR